MLRQKYVRAVLLTEHQQASINVVRFLQLFGRQGIAVFYFFTA